MVDIAEELTQALQSYQLGDLQQAKKLCYQILQIQAEQAEAWHLLGLISYRSGNYQRAIHLIKQAIAVNPEYAKAYFHLGYILQLEGHPLEALTQYCQALTINLAWVECRQLFACCLNQLSFSQVSPQLLREVEICFEFSDIDKQRLVTTATVGLKGQKDFKDLFQLLLENQKDVLIQELYEENLASFFSSKLVQFILIQTVVVDRDLEYVCMRLRRNFLLILQQSYSCYLQSIYFQFACSLALQCFNNEYIFQLTIREEAYLTQLKEDLEHLLAEHKIQDTLDLRYKLIIFSMYHPIFTLVGSHKLLLQLQNESNSIFSDLIKKHIVDHQQELKIKKHIPLATTIDNSISILVQSQYDENPYPRWLSLDRQAPQAASTLLSALFPHFHPPPFLEQPLHILVAGCGTGKHAISVATRFQNSQVWAIDLSTNSLTYAIRMACEMKIDNINFYQGDLLNLLQLNLKFPLIECVGVLHHLQNPLEGWRVLTAMLLPSGLMKIGLYSHKGRQAIQATREFIRSRGFAATPQGIREARAAILSRDDDPMISKVTQIPDFYNLSSCRDLLFHVQEKSFTLLEIQKALDELNLQFIGFEMDDTQTKRVYRALFSEDYTETNLYFWHKFEDIYPNIFLGMYKFWCQKI